MTLREAREKLHTELNGVYDHHEAAGIASLVVENLTGKSLTEIITANEIVLSGEQIRKMNNYIDRLKKNEPVQYVLNEAWFAGQKLYVDKHVLIPRPETEELVEWLVEDVRSTTLQARQPDKNEYPATGYPKMIDIGTGSGCIAIAIKKKLPGAEVWACDISDEALMIARKNADDLKALIDFVQVDFLNTDQRRQLPFVDIIISNPPYIPLQEKNEMNKNVTDYEPSLALFVTDNDPLVFYHAIADFGNEKLHAGGSTYLEIHEDLGEKVKQLFKEKGFSEIEVKKDMQGKERMIKAVKNF